MAPSRKRKESYFVSCRGIVLTVWPDAHKGIKSKEITSYQIPPAMELVRLCDITPEMEVIRQFRDYSIVQSDKTLTERVLKLLSLLEVDRSFSITLIAITCLDELILFRVRRGLLDVQKVEKTYDTLNKVKALALGTSHTGEQTVALERAIVLSRKICEL